MIATKMHTQCYAVTGVLLLSIPVWTLAQSPPELTQQIAAVMSEGASGKAHLRYVHAKGIVCQGSFQPSSAAAEISRAAHFAGGTVLITLRFSDGASDLTIADNSPGRRSAREWRSVFRWATEPTLWQSRTTGLSLGLVKTFWSCRERYSLPIIHSRIHGR